MKKDQHKMLVKRKSLEGLNSLLSLEQMGELFEWQMGD